MTLDSLLQMLHCHLAALQSSAWPRGANTSAGPALYLDEAETQAVIAELKRVRGELAAARTANQQFAGATKGMGSPHAAN